MQQSFDIVIVGPGHVGAAAALQFAREGRRVALVGPAAPRRDGRTVALLEGSWRLLSELGVAARLEDDAAPLAVMRLVDDTGSLFRRPPTEFKAHEIGLDQFGWNVETATLTEALLAQVALEAGITRFEAAAESLTVDGEQATVTLSDGTVLLAALAVGADGRKSVVRRDSKIGMEEWRYPQTALTTIVAHSRPHRDVSTEFHTRAGPCTVVPLPGKRSSVVCMTEPAEGERLLALDDEALARAIEARTHAILGQLRIDGPRGLVPMGGLSVERFAAARVALIGEAAHVFPPIGAQGLNLGLRDVRDLVTCVVRASDLGEALRRYETGRRSDVRTRTGAVDALNRSLLTDLLPVDFARGLGLLALDSIAPLRRFVMRQGLNPSQA